MMLFLKLNQLSNWHKIFTTMFVMTMLFIFGFMFAATIYAQSGGGYDLSWQIVASGGGTSSGSGYTVTGTIGQSVAGYSSNDTYAVGSGFWGGKTPIEVVADYFVYLPSILR